MCKTSKTQKLSSVNSKKKMKKINLDMLTNEFRHSETKIVGIDGHLDISG